MRATGVNRYLGWLPMGRQWAPSLRYLLRRVRILNALPPLRDQDMLEIGCGAGTLLIELSRQGLRCTGLETSPDALQLAGELIADSGEDVRVLKTPDPHWAARFEIIGAFDVLEHIKDDAGALAQWIGWLKPGGSLLLTVPAHPSRWGAGDVWAGHYRRYTRDQFLGLVRDQGMQIERIECYGFPVANMTEMVGEWHYRNELRRRMVAGGADRESGNELSGVDRKTYRRALPLLTTLPGRMMVWCALKIQTLALRTDWGSGYLVVARKP